MEGHIDLYGLQEVNVDHLHEVQHQVSIVTITGGILMSLLFDVNNKQKINWWTWYMTS